MNIFFPVDYSTNTYPDEIESPVLKTLTTENAKWGTMRYAKFLGVL
jgi:hypothetical protein